MKLAGIEINKKQRIFFWINLISFLTVIYLERKWYMNLLVLIMYLSALWIFSFQDKQKVRGRRRYEN